MSDVKNQVKERERDKRRRFIKDRCMLKELNVGKPVELFLTRYLDKKLNLARIPNLDKRIFGEEFNKLYVHYTHSESKLKLNQKLNPSREYDKFNLFEFPESYLIELGPNYFRWLVGAQIVIGGEKRASGNDNIRAVAKYDQYEQDLTRFNMSDKFYIVKAIVKEFGLDMKVDTFNQSWGWFIPAFYIGEEIGRKSIRSAKDLERRINNLLTAAHTIDTVIRKSRKKAYQHGEYLAQEAKRKFLIN